VSLKCTILGLLIDKPMHGYQLKRVLSPGLSNDKLVNDGVLYPLLKKMEREGLVRKEVVQGENAPPRHLFRPTGKGREAFFDWLGSDTSEEDEVKYDFFLGHPFLNKCLFFDRLEPGTVVEKFINQKERALAKRREFQRIRDGMARRGVRRFRIAILDLGMVAACARRSSTASRKSRAFPAGAGRAVAPHHPRRWAAASPGETVPPRLESAGDGHHNRDRALTACREGANQASYRAVPAAETQPWLQAFVTCSSHHCGAAESSVSMLW
jgi:DNA-binding PadR family transcriptional regulator